MNVVVAYLTLTSGEKEVKIYFGYDPLSYTIGNIADDALTDEVLILLAGHQSAEVRSRVAGKDKLPEAAIRLLAQDSSLSVLISLLGSNNARALLTTQELLAICKADPELSARVADSLEEFSGMDNDDVLELLEHHPDPDVRMRLAGNYRLHKRTLQRIANKDPDEEVRMRAYRQLTDR